MGSRSVRFSAVTALGGIIALSACATSAPDGANRWRVALAHDENGVVSAGGVDDLVSSIRNGCALRIGWGARRARDPSQTIEHVATPVWIAIRNDDVVEIQLDDFLINLSVLGEPPEDHANREQYGGVDRAVSWRANLKTDGTFNAVWYDKASGDFVTRVPQRHPMRWFVDCASNNGPPLYPAAG